MRSPYVINWAISSAGEYSLQAKLIRSDGSVKESAMTKVTAYFSRSISNGEDDIEVTSLNVKRTSPEIFSRYHGEITSSTSTGVSSLPSPNSLEELFYKTTSFTSLNQSQYYMRPVFSDYPQKYEVTNNGLLLKHDASQPFPESNRIKDRAELREKNNTTFPENGTTQIYQVQFKKIELPTRLFGKVHFFQRFNKDVGSNGGPDCGLALTGAYQWSGNAVEKSVYVHCFDQYYQFNDVFLKEQNDLVVAIYTHPSNGRYKVSLNGRVLTEKNNVDTSASTDGTWIQTGIYPSGLTEMKYDDHRQEQVSSGEYRIKFELIYTAKFYYNSLIDFYEISSHDFNEAGQFFPVRLSGSQIP